MGKMVIPISSILLWYAVSVFSTVYRVGYSTVDVERARITKVDYSNNTILYK